MNQRDAALVFCERRTSTRRPVDLPALGTASESDHAFECRITDLSESGARLVLPDCDIAPDRFKIFVLQQRCLFECETIWRARGEVGVRFTKTIRVGF